ncbi:hypothetical protein AAFF_G00151930 [Aldrovandia affinis]|uniref:Ig-like domain-containing protein n=1 Tax=Aldrovandia affinis TaxID=143900 RepID=A0AAD7W8S1_9TELE|nr:hypothetical protein AAFF_G00151930 [Aldrovandia affinis]
MASLLLILVALSLPGSLGDVSTVKDLAVLEGRSVTIPCHYEPQYTRHVKYWCRGVMKDFCSSLARTDTAPSTDSKVFITDDPAQQLFTVTMRNLQEEESGWYWCGVEVGGMWRADDTVSVHITVTHGMSVVNSMLVGEEGGSISVQCLYGSRHSGSIKKWCRSGDWGSCLEADSNGTLEGGPVLISDDRVGAFTVTVRELEQRDTGWYWCAAGQQQVAVHITVTLQSATQRSMRTSLPLMTSLPTAPKEAWTSSPPPRAVHTDSEGQNSFSYVFGSPLMICGSLLLLATAVMVALKIWHHYRRMHKRRDVSGTELTLSPDSESDQTKTAIIFFNSSSPQQVHMF